VENPHLFFGIMEKLEFDRHLKGNPEKLLLSLRDFSKSPKFVILMCGILLAGNGMLDALEKSEENSDQVKNAENPALLNPLFSEKKMISQIPEEEHALSFLAPPF